MTARFLEQRTVDPADLDPYPGNPNVGDVDAIRASLRANGQYRAPVARLLPSGRLQVLAGHATRTAATAEAMQLRVDVVEADDATARRIVLADNRTAQLASYDEMLLLNLLREADGDLTGTGWDDDAHRELLDSAGSGNPFGWTPPAEDADATDEPPEIPITELGDVWILGQHRLACGDSRDPATLDSAIRGDRIGCLLTDPPYGMNLDADYSKMPGGNAKSQMNRQPKKYRNVIGDDRPFDASPLRAYFAGVREQFWFGADYYRRTLSTDDRDGSWLIWDKRTDEQDDVIGSGFETCWSAQRHQRRMLRHYWCGAFGNPEARNRFHPTQKPVALLVDILQRWAPDDLPVADPYGGSGSTLIAAHTTGRPARLIELDPGYCDVTARRWQTLTGDRPVLERTGELMDLIAAHDGRPPVPSP